MACAGHSHHPSSCEPRRGPTARLTSYRSAHIWAALSSLTQVLTQLSLWVWPLEALGPARHHAPRLAHVLALSALAQKSRGWRRLARKPVPLPPAPHPRQLHPVGCRTDDAPLPSTEHLCVGYRRSQAGIPQKQSLRQGFKETNPGG